jgi:hypothetical protein
MVILIEYVSSTNAALVVVAGDSSGLLRVRYLAVTRCIWIRNKLVGEWEMNGAHSQICIQMMDSQ